MCAASARHRIDDGQRALGYGFGCPGETEARHDRELVKGVSVLVHNPGGGLTEFSLHQDLAGGHSDGLWRDQCECSSIDRPAAARVFVDPPGVATAACAPLVAGVPACGSG